MPQSSLFEIEEGLNDLSAEMKTASFSIRKRQGCRF
jgi:hypothetical protein